MTTSYMPGSLNDGCLLRPTETGGDGVGLIYPIGQSIPYVLDVDKSEHAAHLVGRT